MTIISFLKSLILFHLVRWNPAQKNTEEMEEDEEDEEKEEMDEPEPESGPPLLTPLNEDDEIDGTPAWSTSRAQASKTIRWIAASTIELS